MFMEAHPPCMELLTLQSACEGYLEGPAGDCKHLNVYKPFHLIDKPFLNIHPHVYTTRSHSHVHTHPRTNTPSWSHCTLCIYLG